MYYIEFSVAYWLPAVSGGFALGATILGVRWTMGAMLKGMADIFNN